MDKILRIVLIFGIVISSVYLYYKCADLIATFEDANTHMNGEQDVETSEENTLDYMTIDKIRSLVEGNIKNVLQNLFSNLNSENLTLSSIANDIQNKSDPVVSIRTMLEGMKQYISEELWINKRRDIKIRNKLQHILDTDVNNLQTKLSTYIQDYGNNTNDLDDTNLNMTIQYICNELLSIFAKSMRDMYKVVVDWHESQINKYNNKNMNNFSKLETQLDIEYTEYYKYEEFLDTYIYITTELKQNNIKLLPIEYNLNENRVRFSDLYLNNFLNAYVTESNSLLVDRYNS
jgi:hypothetical protein